MELFTLSCAMTVMSSSYSKILDSLNISSMSLLRRILRTVIGLKVALLGISFEKSHLEELKNNKRLYKRGVN